MPKAASPVVREVGRRAPLLRREQKASGVSQLFEARGRQRNDRPATSRENGRAVAAGNAPSALRALTALSNLSALERSNCPESPERPRLDASPPYRRCLAVPGGAATQAPRLY